MQIMALIDDVPPSTLPRGVQRHLAAAPDQLCAFGPNTSGATHQMSGRGMNIQGTAESWLSGNAGGKSARSLLAIIPLVSGAL
jgi:hypothetical protein